jgi:putative ABC transport system permease protein
MAVAFPLSYWAITEWMSSFAYKSPIGAWIFIVAGLLMLLVASVTISFQAVKAAIANPVKSLRTE